jgi:hypothetical protein
MEMHAMLHDGGTKMADLEASLVVAQQKGREWEAEVCAAIYRTCNGDHLNHLQLCVFSEVNPLSGLDSLDPNKKNQLTCVRR